jgi:FkbM family methyltransferase
VRNIRHNGLEKTIIPFELAITARSDETVYVPLSANPYNSIQSQATGQNLRELGPVRTISLADIFARNSIERVHLLKVDCEGAEYTLFPATSGATLAKIENIRLEYHAGPVQELISALEKHGLGLVRYRQQTPESGIAWFSREQVSR